MGGYGSGRHGGRALVEDVLTLTLNKLLSDGLLRPGQHSSGSLVWTTSSTREQVATIGYQAELGEDRGRLRLQYTSARWSGEKQVADYWIDLIATLQPFGGRRWWFKCPARQNRVAKLHLPSGGTIFASQRAYGLGYRSQRETPRDRSLSRAFKLRDRIGGTGGIGDYIRKPDRMHWATFDRRMARIEAAEEVVEFHGRLLLDKLERLESRASASAPPHPLTGLKRPEI